VYSVAGPALRNITSEYREHTAAALARRQPKRVDAGDPVFERQLGPGWYALDSGFRWMGKGAIVYLGAPSGPGEKLRISGFCPPQQSEKGKLGLRVAVNGHPIGRASLGEGQFEVSWPLAEQAPGTESLQIGIEVERTFYVPGDARELGLAFGLFSVAP
jgi:hypothetical protein